MVSGRAAAAILAGVTALVIGVAYTLSKSVSSSPPPPGSFIVKVVDASTQAPISGANVTYAGTTKVTDSSGATNFVPTTGFTPLTVTKAGYQDTLEPNFQGVAGQTYTVSLQNLGVGTASINIEVLTVDTFTPVSGAKVSVNGTTKTTDAGGLASFSGLTIGATYTVGVSATGFVSTSQDVKVATAGETFAIYLNAVNGPLTATISKPANGSVFSPGQQITFTGQATGGTSPYNYRWFLGGVLVGSGQSITISAPAIGDYVMQLNVEDAASTFTNAVVSFSVA